MLTIKIRPNKKRGVTVLFLLGLMAVCKVLIIPRLIFLKSQVKDTYTIYDIKHLFLDDFVNILILCTYTVYIFSIIYYLLWFSRAYYNVEQFGRKLPYSLGMSIGAWFIPIFHWIGPIQLMLGIYRQTENILDSNHLASKNRVHYVIISVWWTLYICAGLEGISRYFYTTKNNTPNLAKNYLDYLTLISSLNLILTIMAILVVYYYSKLENKLSKIPNVIYDKKDKAQREIIDYNVNI